MNLKKFGKILFFTALPALLIFAILMLYFFGILHGMNEAAFWLGILSYFLALILTPLLGWGTLFASMLRKKKLFRSARWAFGYIVACHLVSLIVLSPLFYILTLNSLGYRPIHPEKEGQYGPELRKIDIVPLDRNKNGKPDALRITFVIHSDQALAAFGGTELCIGDEFRYFVCKEIQQAYADENMSPGIGFQFEDFKAGDTTYTRYLYFDKVPKNNGKKQYLDIKMIGANSSIMNRNWRIDPVLDLKSFEALPIGDPMFASDGPNAHTRLLRAPIE
jgi:hypothetical protein